jgi:molybdate transport system ATP-binding protein
VEIGMTGGRGLDADIRVARGGAFTVEAELSIPPGRTVALLGPNGAGKSTVVAAIAGLLPLQQGAIALGGRVLDDPGREVFVAPEDRRIGVVFQDYLLFPHLSVLENVAFGLRSSGVSRREARDRAHRWLGRLDIAPLAGRKAGGLSGGQAQQVAFARALITEPDLLLLDEPLAALDATTRLRTRRALGDHLEGFSGPRLVITHEPTEAFLLADEIVVLEEGRVTQTGGAQDIRLRPRTRYIADLAGSNLLEGEASAGVLRVAGHELAIGDTTASGRVTATIHPRAVSLYPDRPEGSPRNTWFTTLTRVEHYGDRVRVQTGPPLPLTVEVTPPAEAELGLEPGASTWLSIKATEISVEPS